MSVVIATALLSPAFFSCQKEASPQGTEPTPVQIYILRAKKTTLQGLDLFFFHDDALALLDSYQHIDAPAQERVQGIAGSGAHHLVAFSNVPASRFQWSDIRSVPALSSVSFSLEDDSPAAPFLFGQCPLEEGRSRRCTLRLTPALCKIELCSLSCDFRGKAYEGLPFHLERIFLTYANEAYQPLSPGTAMSYRNPGYLAEAKNLAEYHHEKWNGNGYPHGIEGEEIPLSARIMAVADVFDALVSRRSYKRPFSFEKAMSIIQEDAGTHFDPLVAKAFLASKEEVRKVMDEFDKMSNPYGEEVDIDGSSDQKR